MSLLLENFRKYLVSSLGYAENTAVKYLGNVRNLLDDFGIASICNIDAEEINSVWLAELWDRARVKRGISNSTVITYQSALKLYFKFLEEAKQLPAGTANKIKLAKPDEVSIYGLSREERLSLAEYLPYQLKTDRQLRDAALIMFLWGTGCRISEALKLSVHETGTIYTDDPLKVSGSFRIYEGDVFVHFEHTKHHQDRSVPVPAKSVAYLRLYLDYRQTKSSALFLSHAWNYPEERLQQGGAIQAIKRVFKKCGIERPAQSISHAFRHTAIEKWILDGISEQKIITMAGMRDGSSLKHYFKRSRSLVKVFAHEGSSLNNIEGLNKKITEFEEMIKNRYSLA